MPGRAQSGTIGQDRERARHERTRISDQIANNIAKPLLVNMYL